MGPPKSGTMVTKSVLESGMNEILWHLRENTVIPDKAMMREAVSDIAQFASPGFLPDRVEGLVL